MTMRDFARDRATVLLGRFVFQMNRAARLRDAESVHDLRVSIRRLQQCLVVFGQFLPHAQVKKIRRRLHQIMQIAGEVRNRDIALELLGKSGMLAEAAISRRWRNEAGELRSEFQRLLEHRARPDLAERWLRRLGL